MVTETNLLQYNVSITDEIIINKTYFINVSNSNNQNVSHSKDIEPNSQNQLDVFTNMVRTLQKQLEQKEKEQKKAERLKKIREELKEYVELDLETTEALHNAWGEENTEHIEENWFNEEDKNITLADNFTQNEIKQIDSERISVDKKLRNFFKF